MVPMQISNLKNCY